MSKSPPPASTSPELEAEPKLSKEVLFWVKHWNADLMSFRIHRPADFVFAPGQYTRIGLHQGGSMIWRPYSIASAPHEEYLEFFLVTSRGHFSRCIGELQVGSHVFLEHNPAGSLSIDRFHQPLQGQDLWLLSTGTGLSPFLSLLRDATAFWRFEHIVLVISVREPGELAYAEELDHLAAAYALEGKRRFVYVTTFTQREIAGAAHGRINVLLESGVLQKRLDLPTVPARSRFMLSGNPEMIADVSKMLKTQGFRLHRSEEAGQVIVENYW